ncbi:MAG TPA: hypothetical protein VLE96_04235 [Chlamydiales bacterium]|nr:hypothetical protein [Chlamydiales bacterium]
MEISSGNENSENTWSASIASTASAILPSIVSDCLVATIDNSDINSKLKDCFAGIITAFEFIYNANRLENFCIKKAQSNQYNWLALIGDIGSGFLAYYGALSLVCSLNSLGEYMSSDRSSKSFLSMSFPPK